MLEIKSENKPKAKSSNLSRWNSLNSKEIFKRKSNKFQESGSSIQNLAEGPGHEAKGNSQIPAKENLKVRIGFCTRGSEVVHKVLSLKLP